MRCLHSFVFLSKEGKPIYMAVKGVVFDVTGGKGKWKVQPPSHDLLHKKDSFSKQPFKSSVHLARILLNHEQAVIWLRISKRL